MNIFADTIQKWLNGEVGSLDEDMEHVMLEVKKRDVARQASLELYETLMDDVINNPEINELLMKVSTVHQTGKYDGCHRAIYGAAIIDLDDSKILSGPYYNYPPNNLLDVCRWEDTCIRGSLNLPHLSAYENCPAVHAAGRLSLPTPVYDRMVWVEAGCYRDSNGDMQWWSINPESAAIRPRIYSCIRCLTHVSYLGIKNLVVLYFDLGEQKMKGSVHDVNAHLSAFLVQEVYKGLKNKNES